MTLVQVVADETAVHMSCDFRLTDLASGRKADRDAHKLITVQTLRTSALVGITGLGDLDGKPVGQWVAEVVGELGQEASVDVLLDMLRRHAEPALAKVVDPVVRRHTFVVGSIAGTQAMVSLISNFETLDDGRTFRQAQASSAVRVTSIKPKKPIVVLAGSWDAVHATEQQKLELLVRSKAPDGRMQEALAASNEVASRRTVTVSAGCHAASIHATGSGSAQPFLTTEHPNGYTLPEAEVMFRKLGLKLNPRIGEDRKPMPIRMMGSTFGRAGGDEQYFREQFKLQPDSAELWNNYGSLLSSRRRPAEAAAAFEKAISLDPAYVTAVANLAKVKWLSVKDLERAKNLYVQALRLTEPSVPTWILSDAATFYAEGLGDHVSARALHERAVTDPEYPLSKARLAHYLLAQEGVSTSQAAQDLFEQALTKQPNDAQILRLAGQADFLFLSMPNRALERLHRACSLTPQDPSVLIPAAGVCLATGDADSAAYYYRKAFRRIDPDWLLESNYGLALLATKKPDGAMRHLRRAQKLSPSEPAVLTNLAAALWVTGGRGEATQMMHDTLSRSPEADVELELLAMLYCLRALAESDVARLRELFKEDVRSDGVTLRSMARVADRDTGAALTRLAGMIESPPGEQRVL